MFISKRRYNSIYENHEKEKSNLIRENDRITHESRKLKVELDRLKNDYENYKSDKSVEINNLKAEIDSLKISLDIQLNDLNDAYADAKSRQKKDDAKPTGYMNGISYAIESLKRNFKIDR